MSRSSEARKSKAVELASKYTPQLGKILEVSCGRGQELLHLQQAGYDVTGTNFTKYDDEAPSVRIDHGIDLLKGLPYADVSFDTVMLLDVIEHLANHDQAISELARVCKVGGHVIIMTPNITKLSSRVNFLLTGFFKAKRSFIGFDIPPDSAFAFHNYPVHLPVCLYQIESRGLKLSEFTASVYKKKSFILYFLLWPFVTLATLLEVNFREKNLKGTEAAKELGQCLNSVAGLCGEFYFIVAQKMAVSEERKTSLPKWAEKREEYRGPHRHLDANAGDLQMGPGESVTASRKQG